MRQRKPAARSDQQAPNSSPVSEQDSGSAGSCLTWLLLLVLPGVLVFAAHAHLKDAALLSEEAVLGANVLHPIFHSDEHFHAPYWRPEMLQRARLESLTQTLHGTARALERLGLQPFLESASLIGWLRHDGGQIPWDIDGDVGISVADCRALEATKAKLAAVISEEFEVLKFACECEEDCTGDNLRMVGRVTHRATGVCIDIFAYAPVKQLRPWQTHARYAGVEWWERVNDHADYTFPKTALFPLQNGSFAGSQILIPNDARDFLGWEYGQCLGAHVWPWRLWLYSPMTMVSAAAFVARSALLLLHKSSFSLGIPLLIYTALVVTLFNAGGVSAALTLFLACCEVCVLRLSSGGVDKAAVRRHRWATLLIIAALVYDLRGNIEQLVCQVDDFYIRPRRPKSWTLCILGHCWDF